MSGKKEKKKRQVPWGGGEKGKISVTNACPGEMVEVFVALFGKKTISERWGFQRNYCLVSSIFAIHFDPNLSTKFKNSGCEIEELVRNSCLQAVCGTPIARTTGFT